MDPKQGQQAAGKTGNNNSSGTRQQPAAAGAPAAAAKKTTSRSSRRGPSLNVTPEVLAEVEALADSMTATFGFKPTHGQLVGWLMRQHRDAAGARVGSTPAVGSGDR